MITTERQRVSILQAIDIIQKSKSKEDMIRELCSLTKRNQAPKPPDDGITIRNASRKFRISHTTISGWVCSGTTPILLSTPKRRYISEKLMAFIAARYNREYGRGKANKGDNETLDEQP